jgi:hypothetical protein
MDLTTVNRDGEEVEDGEDRLLLAVGDGSKSTASTISLMSLHYASVVVP